MIGKTVVEEIVDVEDYRILVFEDGTGYHLHYELEITASQVEAVRAATIAAAELAWLRSMERDWYRNVATCDQRVAWNALQDNEPEDPERRRGDDLALVEVGFYAEPPRYCPDCGEAWCPKGREGTPGPAHTYDALLRGIWRAPRIERALYQAPSILDGLKPGQGASAVPLHRGKPEDEA